MKVVLFKYIKNMLVMDMVVFIDHLLHTMMQSLIKE